MISKRQTECSGSKQQTKCSGSRLRGKRYRVAVFVEDSNVVTLKDQDAILNRWRDYLSDF